METPINISEGEKSSVADVKHLRQWLTTQPHLPNLPENMLHLFHHSCYYDFKKTKDCIDSYYTLRTNTPEIFKDRNITDVKFKMTIENTVSLNLPATTPDGYKIIFQRIQTSDISKYNFDLTCKLFFMGLDLCIHKEGIYPGYVLVLDYKNIRLGHLAKTNLGIMRKMFKYIQEGSPIRLKSIHMINMNYFVEKVMAFVKPFMHKDLYNLIHFYPDGSLEKLESHVPISCLPIEYGGDAGNSEILYSDFIKKLEENYGFFNCEESTFIVNEKLRPKKSKKNKKGEFDDSQNEVSLKSLEID